MSHRLEADGSDDKTYSGYGKPRPHTRRTAGFVVKRVAQLANDRLRSLDVAFVQAGDGIGRQLEANMCSLYPEPAQVRNSSIGYFNPLPHPGDPSCANVDQTSDFDSHG